MKTSIALGAVVLLSACASSLTFVEQGALSRHSGAMDFSVTDEGRMSALIDGKAYEGAWTIENTGSAITYGEVEYDADKRLTKTSKIEVRLNDAYGRPDTASGFARIRESSAVFASVGSFAGDGRAVLTSEDGSQILCSFDPAVRDGRKSGLCTRDDGVSYDLIVRD